MSDPTATPRSPAEAAALGKRLSDEGRAVGWPLPERPKCGHKHLCACGMLWLPSDRHTDPEVYARTGGCDRPCAYCDTLDADAAERG